MVRVQCTTTASITLTAGGICMESAAESAPSLAGQKVLMTLAVDRKGFPPGKLNSPARAPDMAAASSKRHFREPPLTSNLSVSPYRKKWSLLHFELDFLRAGAKGSACSADFLLIPNPSLLVSPIRLLLTRCQLGAKFAKYHHGTV